MDALRQTPGVTGAAFANQLPLPAAAAAAPPSTSRAGRRMPRPAGVLHRGHTGLLFDAADVASLRPVPERVRPEPRCVDGRDQRGRCARVLARPQSDRRLRAPQCTRRRPPRGRRRRRRRAQQRAEQAGGARDLCVGGRAGREPDERRRPLGPAGGSGDRRRPPQHPANRSDGWR